MHGTDRRTEGRIAALLNAPERVSEWRYRYISERLDTSAHSVSRCRASSMSPRTAAALLIAAPPASAADDAIEPHHCWASRAVNWANIHRSQLYAVTIIACNTASVNYYHNLPATPGVLMTFVSVGLRHTHSSVIGLLHVGRFYDHATAHLATGRPVPCLSVRLSLGRSCVQMADPIVNQTCVYKIYSLAYLSTKPNYDTIRRSTFKWALEELTHRRLNLAHGADPQKS